MQTSESSLSQHLGTITAFANLAGFGIEVFSSSLALQQRPIRVAGVAGVPCFKCFILDKVLAHKVGVKKAYTKYHKILFDDSGSSSQSRGCQ